MSTFLRTLVAEYSRMRARSFAGGYEGVTHAGIALRALDTERVFLTKRSSDSDDSPEVAETWEFPGGGLREDEEPYPAAVREVIEETGWGLPDDATVESGWRSDNEVYQGFVMTTAEEYSVDEWTPTTEVSDIGWFDRDTIMALDETGALRPEVSQETDWDLVFGVSGNEDPVIEEEETMTEGNVEAAQVGTDEEYLRVDDETGEEIGRAEVTEDEEPELSMLDLAGAPIPVHGVLAPEDTESGDSRGFNDGAMTARSYRLPFMWQERQTAGHDGADVVGSVDRLMRKDGLIHWEGALMPTARAGEFTELLAFFGRFGVSVDGDKGSLDMEKAESTGVMWFDAVRAAGLTAVSIPAFSEAYVAFGPHPDMPEEESEEMAVLRASGDAATFDRGPGWATHPTETKRLHAYWTQPGQPGYAKIGWGIPGDFNRAKKIIGEKIGANSPEDLRYLNQIIAQWHHDALGYWPGEHDRPGNPTSASLSDEEQALIASGKFREVSEEERKRLADEGKALPDGSYPIANVDDLRNAIQAIGRAKDPAQAKRHIKKRARALGETDLIPEDWANEGPAFDLVLAASVGVRGLPKMSYFDRHPDTDATVIEEPDENGIRRTYGYAAEWGVCHIGFDNRCVEAPEDPTDGYEEFHLGRTKTDEGYINTGLITYKTEHRDAQTLLSESPEQAHYDNIENAWAAVRLGEDEHGVWFSGVVLPHVPEDDLTLIEASGQVSGEWKYGALRGLQCVNIPGYPVIRSSAAYDDDGNVVALAASAHDTTDCAPSPKEEMQALSVAYAEAEIENLRAQWASYKGE